jgi:hypothetical protein
MFMFFIDLYRILRHVNSLLGNGLVNNFPRRQILGKQSVARLSNNSNNRTAVSVRRSVNTSFRMLQQYKGNCFLCGPRQAIVRNNRTCIARQRSCKHASLTKEDGLFRGTRAEEFSWRQSALPVSQFPIGDSHGKFVAEEKLEVDLWILNVWSEDLMCSVVHWYLECDSYSFCVKIRYKETDRKTFAEE